ncbi:glycosyltransferase family 2 protein [Aurantibacter sp.]|uniref:glycosyltransferase family 2 protein n=1 Tax=Aurantibacter sp. TaxID=2807103 RepID=UPI00326691A4
MITRCRDEFFILEFVNYYISQGVDHIYIIDDDSKDKGIYKSVEGLSDVTVIYDSNVIKNNSASKLYKKIRKSFDWIIYVDVDEFISTNKMSHKTIVEEVVDSYSSFDCVKVPWVMMSSNGRELDPKKLLAENLWRWNHDKKHPNHIHKFRCRFDEIEVKCIFKTAVFHDISDHHPIGEGEVVDSINGSDSSLSPFYCGLTEKKISSASLLCFHYRIISKENNLRKLSENYWYIKHGYTEKDLASSDYAEIFDNTVSVKGYRNKIFIIGFNRCGTRSLHYFFKNNGLRSIHWDSDNLAKTMEKNLISGLPLLRGGRTVNSKVNSVCEYEDAQVFSDITWHKENKDAKDYYRQLDFCYPGSKFILNVRDVNGWIKSRKKHSNGLILKELKEYHSCSEGELEIIWRNMWERSVNEMIEYFKGRDKDLLVFDIENDNIMEVVDFLGEEVGLDPLLYDYVK